MKTDILNVESLEVESCDAVMLYGVESLEGESYCAQRHLGVKSDSCMSHFCCCDF